MLESFPMAISHRGLILSPEIRWLSVDGKVLELQFHQFTCLRKRAKKRESATELCNNIINASATKLDKVSLLTVSKLRNLSNMFVEANTRLLEDVINLFPILPNVNMFVPQ